MKLRKILAGAAPIALLVGCGGGGGSVASTPTPAPARTNATLTNLRYSQEFRNNAAGMHAVWDTSSATAVSNRAQDADVSIAYDAATNGYTVSVDGRSQSYLPSDIVSQGDYDTVYKAGASRLTLTQQGYDTNIATQYVAMALVQESTTAGSLQTTDLTSFTYGLPTSASATPRTGLASYVTQVFGAFSTPGAEPRGFTGEGQIDIDFGSGIFSGVTSFDEYGLVSDSGTTGGGLDLTTVGTISSSGSGLTGTAVFRSVDGRATVDLTGSLYGPQGQELGASFSGDGIGGLSVTGSIVGQQSAALTAQNMSFDNFNGAQLFSTRFGGSLVGQLDIQGPDDFRYGAPLSGQSDGEFGAADRISGPDNFRTYRKTFSNSYYTAQDVTISLYEAGQANSELPLSYASFGHWSGSLPGSTPDAREDHWFAYGFATPNYVMDNRTGTASYEGVAYGTGNDGEVIYDVAGTSHFNVDFSADTFTGALNLTGVDLATDAQRDFGQHDFSGTIQNTSLSGTFGSRGDVDARFYGPLGQEIAGYFYLIAPSGSGTGEMSISGAMAAAGQ